MKLVIETQFRENYGAHSWNGEGECPQYWKSKGGYTYVVTDIDPDPQVIAAFIPTAVKHFDCEYHNNYASEYVIDWYVIGDNELTDEEQFQMGTCGRIEYPPKTIAYSQVTKE